MNRNDKIQIVAGAGILLIVVIILASTKVISVAESVNSFLLIGLVTVTVIYARQTGEIAKATKEQILSEARPYLLIRLNDEYIQWDKDEQGKLPPGEFDITIRNVGNGPAINLWAARWSHETTFFGDSKGYLAPNEEWVTGISKASTMIIEKDIWLPELREVIENKYPGIIAVEYNDIHHRTWVSYLCLERHVDVELFVMEEEQNIVEIKSHD